MERKLTATTRDRQTEDDRAYWQTQSREARLSMVETLRAEARNFLYEYPDRLRRVVTVTRKT